MEAELVLTRDVECESIHGVTGQVYEIGVLEAGAWIRDHVRTERADGSIVERFRASTDGGADLVPAARLRGDRDRGAIDRGELIDVREWDGRTT